MGPACMEGSRERECGTLSLRRSMFSHNRREEREQFRFENGQDESSHLMVLFSQRLEK